MSYQPLPMTITHRAIEHLKSLPPGTELCTAELCEAIGHASSMKNFSWNVARARRAGLLRFRQPIKGQGGVGYWSLGDGAPEPKPEDAETDEPLRRRGRPPRPPAPAAQSSVFDPAARSPAVDDAFRKADAGFRCALWSTGTLEIHRGGQVLTFNRDEARALVDYLRKEAR